MNLRLGKKWKGLKDKTDRKRLKELAKYKNIREKKSLRGFKVMILDLQISKLNEQVC